jgi:V/A-type H+-transporting ATPase subunit I
MAVARLEKYLIVTHKSEEARVLRFLQKKELIELKPYFKTDKNTDESVPNFQKQDFTVPDINIKAKRAFDILAEYEKKISKKMAAKAGKIVVSNHEYESIASFTDNKEIIDEIISIDKQISSNNAKIAEITLKINQLGLWSSFKNRLELLGDHDSYSIKLGVIKARKNVFEEICSEFDKKKISCEVINNNLNLNYIILAYHSEVRADARDYLSAIAFEEADIKGYFGTVQENTDSFKEKLAHLENINNSLRKKLEGYKKDFERTLTIYLDYLENNLEIEWALNYGFSTDNVSFYTAWIKKDDKKTLYNIINGFNFTRLIPVEPEEGETVPTVLENKKFFRPFELIINLYGVPKYFEIDPTPYISIFFALFFGLCMTDAGYGLIFVAVSILLFFKMKGSKNIPMLVLILGIFTILGGAVFNGWFGDLPGYLGINGFFSRFAILGDPLKTEGAMNFFRLSLLLGVIQVIFGLLIKFFDNLFRKEYKVVFLDALPWIVIVVSLVIILLSTEIAVNIQLVSEPLFSASVAKVLIWLILPAAFVIILFGARDEKKWGFRLFMGFLNLTIVSGITSFLGDFLSYIRLMALGLVTAGIGTAVNKIAFQIGSIPVIGIIILVVGLIFGHMFNLGINMLGGFVHTMRLQYVEFFSKFYEGGGKPFEVFKEEHKYISIKD